MSRKGKKLAIVRTFRLSRQKNPSGRYRDSMIIGVFSRNSLTIAPQKPMVWL